MKTATVYAKDIDITQSRAPNFIRFGILSTNTRHIPRWFGYFCYVLSHLQTIAMIFKNADLCITTGDLGQETLSPVSRGFYTLLLPSEWVTYADVGMTNLILAIVMLYLIIILGIAVYILIKLKLNTRIPYTIQFLWSTICYVHNLLVFFPIQALLSSTLKSIFDGSADQSLNVFMIVMICFNLGVNTILSSLSTKFFQVMIKTRDPLSTKNNFVQTHDVGSKLFVTLAWLLIGETEWVKTVILVATLFDCMSRDSVFFYLLPYYHVKTLELGAVMQAATTTLALLSVVFNILAVNDVDYGSYTLEVSWVCVAPLTMVFAYSLVWRVLVRLLLKKGNEMTIYDAVHKRSIFRYLIKKRVEPNQEKHRIDRKYFMIRSKLTKFLIDSNMTFEEFVDDKRHTQDIVKKLLISILKTHPKSELAKVNLAYFYVKYENSFLLANTLIEEVLNNVPSFRARLSMSLVRLELQKKLYIQYAHKEDDADQSEGLNMLKFVEVHSRDDELKKQIDEQIKLQMNFWHNFLSHEPDMGTLAEISTKVTARRKKVARAWRKLLAIRDPKFSRPLLMYGLYSSFVNNEAVVGEKCIEQYQKDVKRYSSLTEKDELTDNTLFSDRTIQVSMSGLRTKLGRILDCSSRIDLVFGWKKELIVDRPITMIMPHFFQDKHDGFLLKHYNTGRSKLLNRTVPMPVMASDGYVIPAWMHIKINPLVEMGLSYIGTLRPTNMAKTMILVRKDGTIDGMAREFAEDMNILDRKSNNFMKIFDFCPNFKSINDAFNIMAYRTMVYNNEEPPSPVTARTQLLDVTTYKDATTPYRGNRSSIIGTHDNLEKILQDNQFAKKIEATPKRNSTKNILDIDNEVQSLFEQFTVGSTLSFYPQKSFPVDDNNITLFQGTHVELEPIVYNVQVRNGIYGKEVIKLVSIEKVFDEDENPRPKIEDDDRYSRHSTSKKTSEPEANCSFEIEADEKFASTGKKDIVKKIGFHPTWEQKQKLARASLLTPISKTRDENTAVHIDESGDFSGLDEIQNYGSSNMNVTGKGLDMNKEESAPYNTRTAPNTGRNTGRDYMTTKLALLPTSEEVTKTENFQKGREKTEVVEVLPKLKKLVITAQRNRFKKVVDEALHHDESGHENLTSMKAHHKDPHLEDNLLKRKLKRLAEKLNKGIVEVNRAEGSIASTYLSKGRKVQTMVTQALKMGNNKKSAQFFIYFCIAFLIISLIIEIVQLVTVYNSIVDVEYKTSVIALGLFRIDALLNLQQSALMYKWWMNGYITLVGFNVDRETFRLMGTSSINDLNVYNNQVRQEISYIGEQFQSLFYEHNVGIYGRLSNGTKHLVTTDSNFGAIQFIVQKALKFVFADVPDVVTTPYSTEDPQYVIDNCLDDLFVASENAVAVLVEDLETSLDKTTQSILTVYIIYLVAVVVFIMVCVNYLLMMRKSAKKFMNLFFRLETKEAEKTRAFLKYFMNSLDSDILDIDIPDDVPEKAEDGRTQAKNVKNYRSASLEKQYRHQIILFLKMAPFFTALIGGCVGYILLMTDIIDQLARKQTQIQSALETQNQLDLLVTELVEIVLENSTTTVRNRIIGEDFLDNLKEIQRIENLIKQFRKDDGSLEPVHEQIFYGLPCDYFAGSEEFGMAEAYRSCVSSSGGQNTMGLAQVNSQLYVAADQLYDTYLATPRTQDQLIQLFYQAVASLRPLVTMGKIMLMILQVATAAIFLEKADQLESLTIIITVATIALILLSSICVWFRMIKKIIAYEAKDREILQIVPIKLILNNRYVRQHLLQDAGGMLDSIKRFL